MSKELLKSVWSARFFLIDGKKILGLIFQANFGNLILLSLNELKRLGMPIEKLSEEDRFIFQTNDYEEYGFPNVTLQGQFSMISQIDYKNWCFNTSIIHYPKFEYRLSHTFNNEKMEESLYRFMTSIDLESSIGLQNGHIIILNTQPLQLVVTGKVKDLDNRTQFCQNVMKHICDNIKDVIPSFCRNSIPEDIEDKLEWEFIEEGRETLVSIKIPVNEMHPMINPGIKFSEKELNYKALTPLQKLLIEDTFIREFGMFTGSKLKVLSQYPWLGSTRLILLYDKPPCNKQGSFYALPIPLLQEDEKILNQLFIPGSEVFPEFFDLVSEKMSSKRISREFQLANTNLNIETIMPYIKNEIKGCKVSISGEKLKLSKKFNLIVD